LLTRLLDLDKDRSFYVKRRATMVLFTTFRAVKAAGRFQQKRFRITSSGASGEWTLLVHVSREAVRAHDSKSNIVSELGMLLCETRS
jgi:hypothetical protein